MATAITLASLATRDSLTKTTPLVPPNTATTATVEVDRETVEATIDLDATTADERTVNLTHAWQLADNGDGRLRQPVLECVIEGSSDQIAWETVFTPKRIALGDEPLGSRAISFVSPHRYLRLRHTLKPGHHGTKASARWSLIGKKN